MSARTGGGVGMGSVVGGTGAGSTGGISGRGFGDGLSGPAIRYLVCRLVVIMLSLRIINYILHATDFILGISWIIPFLCILKIKRFS